MQRQQQQQELLVQQVRVSNTQQFDKWPSVTRRSKQRQLEQAIITAGQPVRCLSVSLAVCTAVRLQHLSLTPTATKLSQFV